MSVDQYLKIAADNVVRAVSELKIEIDRYRAEIDHKKRELADQERDIQSKLQEDSQVMTRNNVDAATKTLHATRAAKLKHDLDNMRHAVNDEITRMSREVSGMEGLMNDLNNKAGSLRNFSGV